MAEDKTSSSDFSKQPIPDPNGGAGSDAPTPPPPETSSSVFSTQPIGKPTPEPTAPPAVTPPSSAKAPPEIRLARISSSEPLPANAFQSRAETPASLGSEQVTPPMPGLHFAETSAMPGAGLPSETNYAPPSLGDAPIVSEPIQPSGPRPTVPQWGMGPSEFSVPTLPRLEDHSTAPPIVEEPVAPPPIPPAAQTAERISETAPAATPPIAPITEPRPITSLGSTAEETLSSLTKETKWSSGKKGLVIAGAAAAVGAILYLTARARHKETAQENWAERSAPTANSAISR